MSKISMTGPRALPPAGAAAYAAVKQIFEVYGGTCGPSARLSGADLFLINLYVLGFHVVPLPEDTAKALSG